MPSPIAHCSLLIPAWTAISPRCADGIGRRRRILLALIVAATLLAPDGDALIGLLTNGEWAHYHNSFSHSLLVAAAAAVPLAGLCRLIAGRAGGFFYLVALSAYGSHVMLDACTWGPGVQMFWPVSDARIATPFPLFYGVRHSVNAPISSHVLTILNDAAFAGVVWFITRAGVRRWGTAQSRCSEQQGRRA